jgi:hypothetical protein
VGCTLIQLEKEKCSTVDRGISLISGFQRAHCDAHQTLLRLSDKLSENARGSRNNVPGGSA